MRGAISGTSFAEPATTFSELLVAQTLLFGLLRTLKYRAAPLQRPMTFGDYGLAALLSAALLALATADPLGIGRALAVAAGTGLYFVLWLDATLYRIFTFELGAGGILGVVLSNLVREVLQMRMARRFFRQNAALALLPVAALLSHLLLVLRPNSFLRGASLVALGGYFLFARWQTRAESGLLGQANGDAKGRRALLHDFLRARRPRSYPAFRPRPEHAPLLNLRPAVPPPSARHAELRGTSVVLLTFESLGTSHLGSFLPKDAEMERADCAHTPFFDGLLRAPGTVYSQHHFCLAPLTNAAHVALYASDYVMRGEPNQADKKVAVASLPALQKAGYKTLYLTAAPVAHYGLAAILRRAGFEHIVDQSSLAAPSTKGSARVSDYDLLGAGLSRLRTLLGRGGEPFFLHVHAANTHVPYRLIDAARFCRHEILSDRGRFLNGVEETDWIFGRLWAALLELEKARHGAAAAPLLVVSSDHGQSFGEKGYFSHGSAVVKEQLNVPLLLHHPRLAAGSVAVSTHFDLLPTVLDLLGVAATAPGYGRSIFAPGSSASPGYLLWDGQPSRSTSSGLGLLLGERKYLLDLVRGVCVESDWQDQEARVLSGAERLYFEALIGALAQQRGIQS